jgi:spore germination cell wall hydrolase CwlJ-like protein
MTNARGFIAAFATTLALVGSSANADQVLQARLGALLGEERKALAVVPDSRMSALTAIPPKAQRPLQVPVDGGIITNNTLSRMAATPGGPEWRCFAEALYHEARGETTSGLVGVGEVIMNRVDSGSYPSSVCGVVHQGTGRKYACQFTWTCDGKSDAIGNRAAFARVGKVATLLLDGAPRELTDGATHYHTNAVSPSWAERFPRTAAIGAHLFYRQPTRSASN